MATLAAALIVRDEAASLARCLGSLSSFVDQIVVVDTGSTDDSRAVARDHGVTLGSFTWVDDFAAARNASLELVTTDWVLYIDADEELLATGQCETRDLLDGSPGAVAAQVLFHPRVGWTPYREWRLFRSRPDLRFRGVIHESILADVERIIAGEGATTAETTLTMQHHGYDGDVSHKHPRDLPLLVAALDSEPDRAYLWDHLARLLHHRGDRLGAEATWLPGIDRALHRGRSDPDDRLLWLGVIGSRV
jgi:glycosyltransferase involved in cell wall biosynthesis